MNALRQASLLLLTALLCACAQTSSEPSQGHTPPDSSAIGPGAHMQGASDSVATTIAPAPTKGVAAMPLQTQGVPRLRLPLGHPGLIDFKYPAGWTYEDNSQPETRSRREQQADSVSSLVSQSNFQLLDSLWGRQFEIGIDPQVAAIARPIDDASFNTALQPVGYYPVGEWTFMLAADSGPYRQGQVDEGQSILNFAFLIAYRNGKYCDHLLVYHYLQQLYNGHQQTFYVDPSNHIHLRQFDWGESNAGTHGAESYAFDTQAQKFRKVKSGQ